jgi:hypothetical protein
VSRRRRSSRKLQERLGGSLRLGAVLATLVGVNVYVFFFSAGSLRQVKQAAQAAATRGPDDPELLGLPGVAAPVAAPVAALPEVPVKTRRGVVKERESLGATLRREGLYASDSAGTLRALQPLMNFKKELRAGLAYSLRFDAQGRLERFELRESPALSYVVARGSDGKLSGERLEASASKARP